MTAPETRAVIVEHQRRHARHVWTQDEVATLLRLWPDSTVSAREIGEPMGLTSQQVWNKASDLKLPLRITNRPQRAVRQNIVRHRSTAPQSNATPVERDRVDALPAGHPSTWGLISSEPWPRHG